MIDRITAKRIVPVIVLDKVEDAEPLAEALLEGGLDIMEITFRTAAASADCRLLGTGSHSTVVLRPAIYGWSSGDQALVVTKTRRAALNRINVIARCTTATVH